MIESTIKELAGLCSPDNYIKNKSEIIIEKCDSVDRLILSLILENAYKCGVINNENNFSQNLSQAYAYSELKRDICLVVKMDDDVINTSLGYIESYGLVLQVQQNINKEHSYAVTPLGIAVAEKFLKNK